MDQSSLQSVKTAITSHFKHDTLDILITNAGMTSETPALSKDGYELVFATNHLANAFVIKLLLPALLHRARDPGSDVRIVQLSSAAAYQASGIDFATLRTEQKRWVGGGHLRYAQSKLANALYAVELAHRYPQILSVSLHPGLVDTPILTNIGTPLKVLLSVIQYVGFAKLRPDEGAHNSLWTATKERGMVKSGTYYEPVGVEKKVSKAMGDKKLAEELWEWTEKELEKF
jgi:NAD(P)-dependent dehydrogenase (short-subunit alcohol dehydrogenase family)